MKSNSDKTDTRDPLNPDDYIRVSRWRVVVGLTLTAIGIAGVVMMNDTKNSPWQQIGAQLSFAFLLAGVVDILVMSTFDFLKERITRRIRNIDAASQRSLQRLDETIDKISNRVDQLTEETDREISTNKLDEIVCRLENIEQLLFNRDYGEDRKR